MLKKREKKNLRTEEIQQILYAFLMLKQGEYCRFFFQPVITSLCGSFFTSPPPTPPPIKQRRYTHTSYLRVFSGAFQLPSLLELLQVDAPGEDDVFKLLPLTGMLDEDDVDNGELLLLLPFVLPLLRRRG